MDISRAKLGLDGDDRVDILNLKLSDPFLIDMLIQQNGYFKGYHIARGNWISIVLDGSVDFEDICNLIDEGYITTASRQTKEKLRKPKEWIIPSNPKYYDIMHAFDYTDEITWKQGKGIKSGDTVYMYVGAPISAIIYKCKVTEANIPYSYKDENLVINELMNIKLIKRYKKDMLTFDILKKEHGINAIRGPRGIPESLSEMLR